MMKKAAKPFKFISRRYSYLFDIVYIGGGPDHGKFYKHRFIKQISEFI